MIQSNRRHTFRIIGTLSPRQEMMFKEIMDAKGYVSNSDAIRYLVQEVHESLFGRPKDNQTKSRVHESEPKLTKEEEKEQAREDEEVRLTRLIEDELKGVCIHDDGGKLVGAKVFQHTDMGTRHLQQIRAEQADTFGEIQYMPSRETWLAKRERKLARNPEWKENYDINETVAEHLGL